MYNDLWADAYEHTEEKRAEVILATAHRLLAKEGGEPEIVLAAAILATVPKDRRHALLSKHVDRELHAEVTGILDADPQNKNAAIVHDVLLLAQFSKPSWKGTIEDLHALIPKFKTESGKQEAKHYLSEREHDVKETLRPGATPVKKQEKKREAYHWADQTALRIIAAKGEKAQYTVASGITPSGVVHFGNFREIITQDLVAKALERLGKRVRYIYSWDDYDTFRKVPKNVPQQEELKKYLFQPTVDVFDPFDCGHASYADHFKAEIMEDLPIVGIFPEFIHQHKRYRACEYADEISYAMQHRDEIREILNEFKTEDIDEDWWPIGVYCQQCNRDRTVKVTAFDGHYGVTYTCQCGYTNTFDLRKHGIAKLPWRVDWPMRWKKEKVDFESAGKEHSSAGGSFDSGKVLVEKVWHYPMVEHFMYEFISVKGQNGKMSSSQGNTITLREVLKVYTPELVRFMFASTRPSATFNVSFDTDIFKLYEDFDKTERTYFGAEDVVNEKDRENAKRIYELSILHVPDHLPVQPSFRHLTNYVQIAEGNMDRVVDMLRSEIKTPIDEARVRNRAQAAWNWVQHYAPDQYRFRLKDKPYPVEMEAQVRNALRQLGQLLAGQNEEELFELFYQLSQQHGIQNTEFFKYAYLSLIGKERGPKLANLITQAGYERIAAILTQL